MTEHTKGSRIVDHLPSAILARIFHFVSADEHPQFYDTDEAPWLTSRVCRRWHKISTSSPHLWSNITLSQRRKKPHPVDSSMWHLLARRLKYARSSSLHIDVQGDLVGAQDEAICMQMLLPEYASWASLELSPGSRTRLLWIDALCPENALCFPLLQHVRFDFSDTHPHVARRILAAFEDAPVLTSLDITQPPPSADNDGAQRFPWDQIRKLAMSDYPESELAQVFQLLQNVDDVNLVNRPIPYDATEASSQSSSKFALPHLTSLYLDYPSHALMTQLTAPNLHELTLPPGCLLEPLLTFARSSGRALRKLTCRNTSSEDTEIVTHLLQELPALEQLQLYLADSDFFRCLLTRLQQKDEDTTPVLCPNLKVLTFSESLHRIDDASTDSEEAQSENTSNSSRTALLVLLTQIVDLFESRWNTTTQDRLHFARVAVSPAVDVDIYPDDPLESYPAFHEVVDRTKKLAGEGMDVDVCWFSHDFERPAVSFTYENPPPIPDRIFAPEFE